jgi:hypothetical protein
VVRKRPLLTEEQILAWAQVHHARTGKWPRHASGPVEGVPGQTWGGVDEALRTGRRGLSGGDLLAKLLGRHLGRRAGGRSPWARAEGELVRALPAREAAARTGRSLWAVYMRRHTLGLSHTQRWRA